MSTIFYYLSYIKIKKYQNYPIDNYLIITDRISTRDRTL